MLRYCSIALFCSAGIINRRWRRCASPFMNNRCVCNLLIELSFFPGKNSSSLFGKSARFGRMSLLLSGPKAHTSEVSPALSAAILP